MMTRSEAIKNLTETPLDLLVIGGGIVGSGVARDAAMRGLRTGLIEQHDFASGTSGHSSRLLHGGLRYLEQGRIKMVREASREKMRLHRIAPHLAEAREFIFPSFQQNGRPLWQLTIGVKLYDLLCGGRNLSPSRRWSREEIRTRLPLLREERLRGAVSYFDAFTNDARLVIDTLASASRHGAALANHLRFHGAQKEGDRWHCDVDDGLDSNRFSIKARAVVNATGPWSEQIPHSQVKLRLSKGIHLVIDRARLPVPSAVAVTEGKRLLFVLPWGERVIIGTTDTDYQGAPEDVTVARDDVTYLLGVVGRYFPAAKITGRDIISSWAGVRPLIANPDGSPSDISREHQIRSPQPGWWDIAGGKLTTYRLMAEQALDQIVRHLDFAASACATADEPLIDPESSPFSSVVPPPCTAKAVKHYVKNEWAVHLDDVMVRRGGWQHYLTDADARAEAVAEWMAAECGWSAERRAGELSAYRTAISRMKIPVGQP